LTRVAEDPDETTPERELTRRLRLRNVSLRCPACDWTLDGPVGDYELVPAGEADAVGLGRRVRVKVYACRNCGYIRLHSASVLSDIAEGTS
jgi:rubredoxin